MAVIISAHGVHGHIKLRVYNSESSILSDVRNWWLYRSVNHVTVVHPTFVKPMGCVAFVKFDEFDAREQVEALKGMTIGISRSDFPEPAVGEYYWTDLCSMFVLNLQGELLGKVSEVFSIGAHDVLRVSPEHSLNVPLDSTLTKKGIAVSKTEILIPFVDAYVINVDQHACQILVDWQRDY